MVRFEAVDNLAMVLNYSFGALNDDFAHHGKNMTLTFK